MVSTRELRQSRQAHLAEQRAKAQQWLEERYCSRRVDDLGVGAPCPDCGHTSLIHPFSGNPGVTHCGLCELEVLLSLNR